MASPSGVTVRERFETLGVVVAGGMGRVHRARDTHTGAIVALKEMLRLDGQSLARFERECAALEQVQHPGVVRHVAHGVTPHGEPWLAMEWLDGVDLAAHLGRGEAEPISSRVARTAAATLASREADGPTSDAAQKSSSRRLLSARDTLTLGRRLASALGAVHGAGLVHRDVKPANVFLSAGDVAHAKLLDLGIARPFGARGDVTGTGVQVGTPWYMAPEQARADGDIGPPADVFSLGCVLYECLVGSSPFQAEALVAVLARILLDDPPPLSLARPDVPAELAAAIASMLEKDASKRPPDGAAVAAMLDAIPLPAAGTAQARVETKARVAALGTGEERVVSVLLARGAVRSEAGDTSDVGGARGTLDRLGVRVVQLVDGTMLASTPGVGTPTDESSRLASAALSLRDREPLVALAIATGRAERGGPPLAELSARAAGELRAARPGEIRVDAVTAALLEGRFVVERDGPRPGMRLVAARTDEAPRLLLGKPTRTVGRRRELAILQATYEEVVEESRARVVLVTGAPGLGKTRLRRELVRTASGGVASQILLGQGDPLSSGSPFVMLAPAILRLARVPEGGTPDERRRALGLAVAEVVDPAEQTSTEVFLGELAGVPYPDEASEALRASRHEPALLLERMLAALERFLVGHARKAPVVVVLEDLHWGDVPSVRALDGILRSAPDVPLLVLALARPEVHARFPALFRDRGLVEIALEPLSPKAATELCVQALGDRASAALVARLVERAGGNAFHLEELVRAAAGGGDAEALPDSVLGMVQARLDALDPEARRVLRAASVVGETFWLGAVQHLLAGSTRGFSEREWVDDLVRRELVSADRDARLLHEVPLRFRHALVRDVAYASIPEAERPLAHARVAEWLESVGERDARTLASHFRAAGLLERAAGELVRAAEEALDAGDLGSAVDCATRAAATHGGARGDAAAVLASAAYWQSRYDEGAREGEIALAALPEGGARFFSAAGNTLVSLVRTGDRARFEPLFRRIAAAHAEPGAEGEQIVALARGTFQEIFAGRFGEADAMLGRLSELATGVDLDARALAQLHHVHGVRAAMVGDVGTFLVRLTAAVDAFERAGDVRNVLLETTTLGWCRVEIGEAQAAVDVIEKNLERAVAARAPQAVTYAKVNLGYALSLVPGRRDAAAGVLRDAIDECGRAQNARLEGWARTHLAAIHRAHGEHVAEENEARRATELLAPAPGLLAWARASLARALVSLGRGEEALPLSELATATLEAQGGLLQGETLVPLAHVEVLTALGRHTEAAARRAAARARLAARAARLPEPAWRAGFLALPTSRET